MFQYDETRQAPFPKRPPSSRVGNLSNSTGGGGIATAITQAVHLDGQASPPPAVLSQTPPHQRPDGGDNASDHRDKLESEPTKVLSWSRSLPSSWPTDAPGAPGDYLTSEGLGDRPILMLPDETAPTDFQFRMGEFGSDAAVAAGGSADALGAAALQGGVSADAWEQKDRNIGVFGILQGNWGFLGTESTAGKDTYFGEDIKSGPAMFVCLQESVLSVYTHLLSPGREGRKRTIGSSGGEGEGWEWEERPSFEYMGFRGPESGSEGDLVIAARTSHVVNCRMRLYWKMQTQCNIPMRDGKIGNTRVMAVTFKMRNWFLKGLCASRGRGERHHRGGKANEPVIYDELTLMTVHMHPTFAQGVTEGWEKEWANWWDKLAGYIVKFRVRILTGDFSMALFRVVPELRARQIPANMVASYMFTDSLNQRRIDSTAIFIIGPLAGATSLFDASMALGMPDPGIEISGFKTKRFEAVKGEYGFGQRAWEIPRFASLGQGYLVSDYQPKDPLGKRKIDGKPSPTIKRVTQCIKWSYEPWVIQNNEVSHGTWSSGRMDEIVMRSQTNWENMWSQKPKKGIGKGKPEEGISAVWDWPEFPYVKQKLVDEKRFTSNWDIEGVGLSTKGAHMPITIYTCGTCLRSPKAETQRRNARKTRLAEAKLKAPSKHRRSQNPEDDILGFDADAAESSGIAAVAAEPGPAWDAREPGPAAFAPEAGLDQRLPANLPIGTANFVQPHETEQQRIDNAMQHYERVSGFAAHSPEFAAFMCQRFGGALAQAGGD